MSKPVPKIEPGRLQHPAEDDRQRKKKTPLTRLSSLGNCASGYPGSSARRDRKDTERVAYEILNKSEREERSGSQKLAEGVVDSL